MKKATCVLLLLAITFSGLTQSTLSKEEYLKKSKKQKTAAFVLLGGGAALTVTGTAIAASRVYNEIGSIITEGENDDTYVAGGIMVATGLAAMVGSVPLFIASGRNKRKAAKITAAIKLENRQLLLGQFISMRSYPAASVKISL